MIRKLGLSLCFLLTLSNAAFGLGKRGDLIGSAGIGLTFSPTLFLLSPQLEYVYRPHLTFGGLTQFGLGDGVG